MSFSRVNGTSWSVGAQLTSAQMNQLDIDHANALDKTVAGDTLSGVVQIAATGSIIAQNANGVTAQAAGGITAYVAAGIRTDVAGGIQLSGGANDWPTFYATRTRTIALPLQPTPLASGWTSANGPIVGPATSVVQVLGLPVVHNGATLTSVSITLIASGPHSSVPASLPSMQVFRQTLAASVFPNPTFAPALSTTSTQAFSPAPGSGSAWDNSGETQLLTYICNQNNVIDNTQYAYYVLLIDEHGSGSVAGNLYYGLQCSYQGIADMRFA